MRACVCACTLYLTAGVFRGKHGDVSVSVCLDKGTAKVHIQGVAAPGPFQSTFDELQCELVYDLAEFELLVTSAREIHQYLELFANADSRK